MSGRPVLVTGALGFVATWLVSDLVASGATVVGVGLCPDEGPPELSGAFQLAGGADPPGASLYRDGQRTWTFLPLDLRETVPLHGLLARLRPAVIYHLAAQSSAGQSYDDPRRTFAANLGGCLELLEAIRALPAADRPFLLAVGSADEYGVADNRGLPLSERTVLRPISPYGVSKAAQSMLCLQYHRTYGLPLIVSRAFSHTGPGQDPRFVFPSFARQIAAAERGRSEPMLRVGNLTPARDYLDVRDVVRAYRLLVAQGEQGQIYNVCAGRTLTIRQGLEILLAEARCPLEVRADPERQRPADIPRLVGDGTKLRQRTGWRPRYDLRDTLREMLALARKEQA
jgi:GDP-4-dehydro-6-deoxy-D-mannose reductase